MTTQSASMLMRPCLYNVSQRGQTPLIEACKKGYDDVVKALLAAKVDKDRRDMVGDLDHMDENDEWEQTKIELHVVCPGASPRTYIRQRLPEYQ